MLAPVCAAELKPEFRSEGMICDRLVVELETRGYRDANGLAADAVGEMMAAKHKLGTS